MKGSIFYTITLLLLFFTNCFGQVKNQTGVREPAVAGSFYPANPTELKTDLASFFLSANDKKTEENAAAIIVPHAGYIFSGKVAASAYVKIDPEKQFKNIFVIGTSHHTVMNGASVYNKGNYRTPLGIVEVDLNLANKLLAESKYFKFNPDAHSSEHSIEVQLPFLQYWLKKPFKIVPIIISTQSATTCQKIAQVLKPYFTKDNLFVISSDFSHYPDYANAVKTDKLTADAIKTNSPQFFASTINENADKNIPGLATSCCGWSSVLTLLCITSETPGVNIQHVKYMNSGDTQYGDKQRVVGYNSFVITLSDAKTSDVDFSLTDSEKVELLQFARETLKNELSSNDLPAMAPGKITDGINSTCGAFVTLTKKGNLRGCIGRFISTEPLYRVVQEMAIAAAFQDTRFSPVKKDELKDIEIEISVLTPLKKISSVDEFELGKQGIYMIKGSASGTFLPQVAAETNWTKEEFLGHCAQDKAGIGWNGWKTASLYTYEALVFNEKEMINPEK